MLINSISSINIYHRNKSSLSSYATFTSNKLSLEQAERDIDYLTSFSTEMKKKEQKTNLIIPINYAWNSSSVVMELMFGKLHNTEACLKLFSAITNFSHLSWSPIAQLLQIHKLTPTKAEFSILATT